MPTPVPIVDYLVLGDTPHLVAHQCTNCEATYFDHRDACANCFKSVFSPTDVSTTGQLQTYTIVAVAAPGVEVPFVAGVVDCQGVAVRASIVNVAPTPEEVHLGMPLRLTTFEVGVDDNGTKAISFGFEPFPTATNEDNA
jgi:uncharacterized OB-fold protein